MMGSQTTKARHLKGIRKGVLKAGAGVLQGKTRLRQALATVPLPVASWPPQELPRVSFIPLYREQEVNATRDLTTEIEAELATGAQHRARQRCLLAGRRARRSRKRR